MADASIPELNEYEGTGPLPDEAQFIVRNPAVGKDRRVSAKRVRETMATPPGTPAQVTAEQVYAFLKAGNGISITLETDGKIRISNTSPGTAVVKPPVGPTVTGFLPGSGPVGSTVTITGSLFAAATSVLFNGTPASFQVINTTTIIAVVPTGATTGTVSVATAIATGTSAASFTVSATQTTTPGPSGTITPGATIGTPGILVLSTTAY